MGYYYRPLAEIIRENSAEERDLRGNLRVGVEQCDLEIGIHSSIEQSLVVGNWQQARLDAVEAAADIRDQGFQSDGIQVYAGDSWDDPSDAIFADSNR